VLGRGGRVSGVTGMGLRGCCIDLCFFGELKLELGHSGDGGWDWRCRRERSSEELVVK
jgi:hypothetical protein